MNDLGRKTTLLLLAGFALLAGRVGAQSGPYSAQIQRLLQSPNTWGNSQTLPAVILANTTTMLRATDGSTIIMEVDRGGIGRVEVNNLADRNGADQYFLQSSRLQLASAFLVTWQSTTSWFGGSTDTGLGRSAAGVVEINNGSAGTFRALKASTLQGATVYSAAGTALPTCNGAAEGTRAGVLDATAPTFGATYTSGGAVHAPVYCDGTNWKTY